MKLELAPLSTKAIAESVLPEPPCIYKGSIIKGGAVRSDPLQRRELPAMARVSAGWSAEYSVADLALTLMTLWCSHRFATHSATNSIRLRKFSQAGYTLYRYHIAQRSLFGRQLYSRLRHNRLNPDTRHGAAKKQTAMKTLVLQMAEFC